VRVVALVPDLLFGSRVQALLSEGGNEVELVADPEAARAAAARADVVLVDLAADPDAGIALVAGGGAARARTIGVYSHVDAETRARAQAAGFDLVVPRSRLVRDGARMLDG
jgi:CheY-like chemotaxis protein